MQNILKATIALTSMITIALTLFVVVATYGITLGALVGTGTLTGIALAIVVE